MNPTPTEQSCPLGGNHAVRSWTGLSGQGVACYKCHKSWTASLNGFIPTHKDPDNA